MLNWIKSNKIATAAIGVAVIVAGAGVAVLTGKLPLPGGNGPAA